MYSIDDAAAHITDASERVLELYTMLRDIVMRREETIQRRWLKKNDNGIREAILSAFPEIPRSHRPDFEALKNPSVLNGVSGRVSNTTWCNFQHLEQRPLTSACN